MFIVTKEIDSENITKLCRTCLREDGEKMVCLFSGPAGSSLAAKLRTLSCLEVWQGDGLPEKLCDRCVTRAESALLYREQCRAADLALRQAASKVSRVAVDTTISVSKLYSRQKNDFASIENSPKSLKCAECEALFSNYHELGIHTRGHLSFVQETRPVQHMDIVESQNSLSYMTTAESEIDKASTVLANTFVDSNISEAAATTKNDRASCALHCSLCNHTFTNRRQLINHHMPTHCHEDAENSCDEENLTGDDSTIEAINYSSHMVLEPRNIISTKETRRSVNSQDQISSDLSSESCNDHIPRYPNFEDVEIHESVNEIFKNPLVTEIPETLKQQHRCNVCEKTFAQRSKLVSHSLSHTGEKPFACLICDKAYTSRSKLNAHNRLHTQTNVHRCNICDKTFSYPSYLTEHLKIHDKTKNSNVTKEYECTVCSKRFRLMKNLKIHLRLHTGKGLVRCEICHKAFGQKYNLKVHLRTHGVVGKFLKCNYCGKSFTARGNYVEHLRIHTRVKPFKCRICNKSFSQSGHLKTHELSHNSSRPHQCRLCGKRYKLAAHLRRHANTHTSIKSYKCEQCNQLFSQAFSLKRHLKRHEAQI
ncbi:zinc finger protein 836-like isoform X2 [Venturia canescens]|uniref:zinc finger protein 836-like isoform X2 n=1 Tax=Venturia canescens TaxID=32260 RepID=UPI001C9CC6D5|nr:zinc finger protein 836-like isoform X2 [Venturia canescens]